jgi:hypothetical protein
MITIFTQHSSVSIATGLLVGQSETFPFPAGVRDFSLPRSLYRRYGTNLSSHVMGQDVYFTRG